MTSYLLIAAIIALYSFQTLFCVLYTKNYPGRADLASPVFSIFEGLAVPIITLFFIGFQFSPSPVTILLGVCNAVMLWGYNTFLIKASDKGSYAFMNLALLFGCLLIPMIYDVCFLHTRLSVLQIIGVAGVLASFVLINMDEVHLKGTPKIYYLFCFLLALCNGMYSVLLKVQEQVLPEENNEMVLITFGMMFVLALVTMIFKEKKQTLSAFKLNRKSLWPLLVCLLCAGLAVNALVYVLQFINVTVYFATENAGVMLLSALYAFFLFKEKPTAKKIIGITISIAAITLLSLPI